MLSLALLLSLSVLQLLLLNGNFLKLLIDDSQLALLDILELGGDEQVGFRSHQLVQ